MPELGSYGSVRGAAGNSRPYRERQPRRRFHARQQLASATGQGTKSRKVERRGCGWRYGDYMSGGTVKPNFWALFQFHPFFCST
jgi:hypothetical protein